MTRMAFNCQATDLQPLASETQYIINIPQTRYQIRSRRDVVPQCYQDFSIGILSSNAPHGLQIPDMHLTVKFLGQFSFADREFGREIQQHKSIISRIGGKSHNPIGRRIGIPFVHCIGIDPQYQQYTSSPTLQPETIIPGTIARFITLRNLVNHHLLHTFNRYFPNPQTLTVSARLLS